MDGYSRMFLFPRNTFRCVRSVLLALDLFRGRPHHPVLYNVGKVSGSAMTGHKHRAQEMIVKVKRCCIRGLSYTEMNADGAESKQATFPTFQSPTCASDIFLRAPSQNWLT